ncbi:N-acetylneuraminate synthase [Cytobacillus sp. FSL H8-0458]|uniref:N-acetylneuraminate synthase n=1 Tax=Cytobacillus sp. FSL H8-0458 TaxID=2975346 RepID=UPI0030FAE910
MCKKKLAEILNGDYKHTYIIAEIGVNHNGRMDLAFKSIDAAIESGADAVKFQFYKVENFVSKNAEQAKYQTENTGIYESQFEMLKRFELTSKDQEILINYCLHRNIDFLATPFDAETADYLYEMGVKAFKIGSGDLTNIPLIKKIDEKGLPIILSTGMANLGEIEEALDHIKYSKAALLHCTSEYPAPYEDVNLKAIVKMGEVFNRTVGYSDHTIGCEASIGAVALGARMIEKHFTLDKNLAGPDHKASMDPKEFKQFVSFIRNIEKCMGDGIKKCMPSETYTKKAARKSLVIDKDMNNGETITMDNLSIKRPGDGIPPKYFDLLIGKTVKRDIKKDTILTWDDVL